jgi:hypothetical protein
MAFNLTFNAPVTNVYNVEGTLILNSQSNATDMTQQLAAIREEIRTLPDVPAEQRQAVETELAAAEAEGAAQRPRGEVIKTHLETAADTLERAKTVAEKAGAFARTLVNIAKWAAVILA